MALKAADEVHYVVTEAVGAAVLERLNPNTHSLQDLYRDGRPRREIYAEMARRIVEPAMQGKRVCAAFYGHSGVLCRPAHEALRMARAVFCGAAFLFYLPHDFTEWPSAAPTFWMPRSSGSPLCDCALTLPGRVHTFGLLSRAGFARSQTNEVSHGGWQGFRRGFRG